MIGRLLLLIALGVVVMVALAWLIGCGIAARERRATERECAAYRASTRQGRR